MAFQSTALIDSSIPRGEIKKIDRPSAFQCHSSQQLYVKLKTQLKFKLFQSDGAPATYVSLNRTLMKIWCSHSISKANGMGLKPDFLLEKCQKSCSNARALTRHTGDVMCSDHFCSASDYRNSPAVSYPYRVCLFTRQTTWKEPLSWFAGTLSRSLLAHFPRGVPQRSKRGCSLFDMICSKYWKLL